MVMSFTQVSLKGHRQGGHNPTGCVTPAASLVGLPCTAMSAPGGSISSVAGIPSTPVLGDMLSFGGLLTLRKSRRQGPTLETACPPVPAKLAARIRRWDFVKGGGGGGGGNCCLNFGLG